MRTALLTPETSLQTSLLPTPQHSVCAVLSFQLPPSSLITEFQGLKSHVVSLIRMFYSHECSMPGTIPQIKESPPTQTGVSSLMSLNPSYICTRGLLLRTVSCQFQLNNNSTTCVAMHISQPQNVSTDQLMNEHGNTLWQSQEMGEGERVESDPSIHISLIVIGL